MVRNDARARASAGSPSAPRGRTSTSCCSSRTAAAPRPRATRCSPLVTQGSIPGRDLPRGRPRRDLRAPARAGGRGAAGACRPAVGRARLRLPRPVRQPRPHRAGLIACVTCSPDRSGTAYPRDEPTDGATMSKTPASPAKGTALGRQPRPHPRARRSREQPAGDVSVDIPKRRLTVFTGVRDRGRAAGLRRVVAESPAARRRDLPRGRRAHATGPPRRRRARRPDDHDPSRPAAHRRGPARRSAPRPTPTPCCALFSRLGRPYVGPRRRSRSTSPRSAAPARDHHQGWP